MFAYPERALFQRLLPKSKVYGRTQPSRALRQNFVGQVGEITWLYKLSPATLNLPAGAEVKEIQIFSIAQRVRELKEEILRTLDRAIPSPLFFELTFQSRVRFVAAYKRTSEADRGKQFVAAYFWSPWQDAATPRSALPVALNMDGLHQQMLRRHMQAAGLEPRSGESLETAAERGIRIRSQRLVCDKLEARMRKEVQFNRKVEINAELRQAKSLLQELLGTDPA